MTELFHYTTKSGDTLALPKQGNLKAGVWRKVRGLESSLDITFGLLEAVCDDKQLAIVDQMELDEVNDLFGCWNRGMQGVTPGESSGSSTS